MPAKNSLFQQGGWATQLSCDNPALVSWLKNIETARKATCSVLGVEYITHENQCEQVQAPSSGYCDRCKPMNASLIVARCTCFPVSDIATMTRQYVQCSGPRWRLFLLQWSFASSLYTCSWSYCLQLWNTSVCECPVLTRSSHKQRHAWPHDMLLPDINFLIM